MELFFLAVLVFIMAFALGSGYPVAFALPGAAILSIILAAATGFILEGQPEAYFHSGGPYKWLSSGVTNLRSVYWDVERDTLIAIPLFIFMGIMLQKSKIAEDLLITMANLFGPVPGGLGISVVFVGALLAATTGIVGATVVAMGLISLPVMLRAKYSPALATGTIAASGTLGQIIPPSIVLIILADQLGSAADQASALRKSLHKDSTGELSMPSVLDVMSTSAGEMFLGAFVPGLVLVLLYMVFILILALFVPKLAPSVPYEGKMDGAFWLRVGFILIPPLTLIFIVLGSIISGIATVNQAGAIGAAGALVMAGYRLYPKQDISAYWPAIILLTSIIILAFALTNYDMNIQLIQDTRDLTGILIGLFGSALFIVALVWSAIRLYKIQDTLNDVMLETAKTTSLVFIILLGAAVLTSAFRAFGGEDLVREFLNSLPGGFWSKFVIVMAVIFILGFFLDFIEIAVVVVPIVAPILLADPSANITAVWLGVMIGLNIQTSFLTPPFGFALFYLRGVAPAIVKTIQMYKGVVPFICLQLVALGIVGYYPALVNYLPNRASYLSDNSPPPKNPKLQYCLDKYVSTKLYDGSDLVQASIQKASLLDLSILPKKQQKELKTAFSNASAAIENLSAALDQETLKEQEAIVYRPILRKVRRLESQIRTYEKEIKSINGEIQIEKKMSNEQEVENLEELKSEIALEVAELKEKIPSNWETTYSNFSKIVKKEVKLRQTYRRNGDQAFETVNELLLVFQDSEKITELNKRFNTVFAELNLENKDESIKILKSFSKEVSSVNGTGEFKSSISKIAREIKKKNPKKDKIANNIENAAKEISHLDQWVSVSKKSLQAPLIQFKEGISRNIGVRSTEKFERETALYIAACDADHRDMSLSF